ncbi:MAG: hypothetical protein DI622_10650, partial [Chryseobacterium sp.]
VYSIAIDHLEVSENRIYIKQEKQNSWQELVTFIPPLFLQALLIREIYTQNIKYSSDIEFFEHYILPNTKYTAIPSAKITKLESFAEENNGLHDLHMHLNGSLETDQVWQDFLYNQIRIYRDLKNSYANPKVREQLEQESTLLEPLSYIKLLQEAKKIRKIFYLYIFHEKELRENNTIRYNPGIVYKHPFLEKISKDGKYNHLMSIEAYMFVLVLEKLRILPNDNIANLLHHYLLILGLTNRLLVQQTHQNGFEQFQKNTLNGLRESSEKSFKRRFFQMHGNDLKFLKFLEGRFSPKNNQIELINQIDSIYNGWNHMLKTKEREKSKSSPEIRLIAHFIKKIDSKPNQYIRHKALRIEVINKGKNLAALLSKFPKYQQKVTGIDAASSEFDAPPEVFAHLFRFMRRKGMRHFTYHAGEDFYHILDGLRAIYEAIKFCDLKKTDRIGHATAAGILVEQWSEAVGNEILISQGCHLDNLIFVYHLIVNSTSKKLQKTLPTVINEINNLSYSVYGDYYTPTILEKAWLMRECCPLHLFESHINNLKIQGVFDDNEFLWAEKKGFVENLQKKKDSKVYEVYEKYHDLNIRKNYNKNISITPFGIIKPKQLKILQIELLNIMATNEIIIETLPTSNVRIGFHKNFSTYHLKNWIQWKMQGYKIPPIVLGSDDTGIFATNIYNEYANVFSVLTNEEFVGLSEGMDILRHINNNSVIYKFI